VLLGFAGLVVGLLIAGLYCSYSDAPYSFQLVFVYHARLIITYRYFNIMVREYL